MTNYFGAISGVTQEANSVSGWWPTDDAPFAAYLADPNEYSTVTEWGDDSGNNRVVSAASFSSDPSFSSTAVGGTDPGVVFTTAELKALGTNATDWNFMASGECAYVGRVQLNSAQNTQVIFSTRNGGFNSGSVLIHDGGASNRLILYEVNGTTSALTVSASPIGVPATVNFIINISRSILTPNATFYVNGAAIGTASYVAANGNISSKAMQFGYAADVGGNWFNGAIEAMAFYNRPLTSEEITNWWIALDGLAATRNVRIVRPIGDSITANASTYRVKLMMRSKRTPNQFLVYQGSQALSGNYPLADQRNDGVPGETISQITARVAGYSGLPVTDVLDLSGTNNMGADISLALADKAVLLDALKAKHVGARIWTIAIPYGNGTTPALTLAGNAGAYNAALPALCASKGVRFIDIHSGAYAWNPATDAADGTGHPTPAGGFAMGNTIAVAFGYGGD